MFGMVRLFSPLRSRAELLRWTTLQRRMSSYEGEGKTTVNVLNKDLDLGIMIDSFSTIGFKLNNGVTVLGPMALFPRTVLSWRVRTARDVDVDSLRLFTLLEPRVDLLVVGLEAHERQLVQPVLAAAHRLRLNVDVLPTEHAAATFNFLTAEGRSVAAALLPPLSITLYDDDILDDRQANHDIFHKL